VERIAETVKQHEPSAAAIGHVRAAAPAAASLPPVLQLQQQAGNQAVQQLLFSGFIQAKLAISNPDDPEEREADNVAHTIMRSHADAPASSPCSCSEGEEMCEECRQKQSAPEIQRRAISPSAPAHVPAIVGDVLRSSGHPLDASSRAFFGTRFGRDFSDVRIHTGPEAFESAGAINAHAYTAGSNIVFASGQYSPDNTSGRSLLAHELTHVVQQSRSTTSIRRSPGPREEEIARSRISPGRVTGSIAPPLFSVYNFAIDSSELKATHEEFLDELADLVTKGAIQNLRLVGHADFTGDAAINGPLSNDRAVAVGTYLRGRGVSVAGISSMGSSSPVVSNSTEHGRNRNRRVDIQFDIVSHPTPTPVPPGHTKPPPTNTPPPPLVNPPPGGGGGGGDGWDIPCSDHPIICGIVGVGIFCLLNPELCLAPLWPGIPWPGGGDGPGPEEPTEPEEPEHECGDPHLPVTHVEYIPASGDKGNRVEARPLTRCEGNKHGSPAKRSDPNWPHGWDCVVQSGQSNLWRRAHLLHGPDLHGPGNELQNIIIADSSINGGMYHSVEKNAIERVWDHEEVLYYEVEVNPFTGPYPRPYFAESVHMKYGTMDPITGVESAPVFDDDIVSSVGHPPPNCTTPPPPGPTQTPTPGPSDDDTHEPSATLPPCDRAELERRVNACVEEARRAAVECTPGFSGGWGGVLEGLDYLHCLDEARRRLLECDRQAKADTHCPQAPETSAPTEEKNDSFDSTLEICRRLLNSRTFHVPGGTLEVEIDADWLDSSGAPAGLAACPMTEYHVTLEKSGYFSDSEIGTDDVTVGRATRLTWSNLDAGEYHLTIWTNNDNPNCCLKGTISVRIPRGTASSQSKNDVPSAVQSQQEAGNQSAQELPKAGYIQAKLAISNPDDPEEREADNVAHTIMRSYADAPASSPCFCSHNGEMCEECQQKQSQPTIQRRASAPPAPTHVPRGVSDVLRSPGHPLDSGTRSFFEHRFGHDFSHVRLHTDSAASASARSINAHAYTAGSDMIFAPGQYAPGTDAGRHLIAHELVHVIQQGNGQSRIHRQSADNAAAPAAPAADQGQAPADPVDHAAVSAAVDTIVTALKGVTTSGDSAKILEQFKGKTAAFIRAMMAELKSRASQNDETPEGMVKWLFKDMDDDDRRDLRNILMRQGVLEDIGPDLVQEIMKGLKGYTSTSDSKDIVAIFSNLAPFAVDDTLSQLEKAAGKSEAQMADWLFGDLDRVSADSLREHFFAVHSDRATRYAARFVAGKVYSNLSGVLGIFSHSESALVVRDFSSTPEAARPLVQFFFDEKTTQSSGKSAGDFLMQKLDEEDYQALRELSGVTLAEYKKESSWTDTLVSIGQWAYTIQQWLVCGLIGVVSGILEAAWGIVKGVVDIGFIAPLHLLGTVVYVISGRTFGVEHWIAVRDFFKALGTAIRHPIDTFDQLWDQLAKQYQTIEGPFADCKRAEFIVRNIVNAIVNIVLIFVGGYGIAKGAYSALKGAAEVGEAAEVLEAGEGAAALDEGGGAGSKVVKLSDYRPRPPGGGTSGGGVSGGGGGSSPFVGRGGSAYKYNPEEFPEVDPVDAPTKTPDVKPAEVPQVDPSAKTSPGDQPNVGPEGLLLPVAVADKLPKDTEPPKCGDSRLPWTVVTPTISDRGEKVVAEPLTRCGPHGSSTDLSNFSLPAWACVTAAKENTDGTKPRPLDTWVHAHLLHGKDGAPDLHGPGDQAWNLILTDKSINLNMFNQVEGSAILGTLQDQTFSYTVEPEHMADTGDRRYFAKGMKITLNRIDPVTRTILETMYSDTIRSGTNRVPPPNCT
jgi:outer membrane protein OmpA-like peptidoglycan-associated protein